ncbi:hypothetical protein DY000_02053992 [Brassica cretica]|uniref:Uncharacterized protein n=1 Tax=Brassica cretica TaxID=69181 RepID=A0ABQ7A9Y4_BRACR|nr:hypothetical protein DY000_02053992 [Brassica cretica]
MSYGQMSIDVRTDVLIVGSAQLSVNELGVSVDERMLLSIDADLFSLRIMRSKSAGSQLSFVDQEKVSIDAING